MSSFACEDAVAMTVAPVALAIWIAASDTPPAAAWTRTHSPFASLARVWRAACAVGAVMYNPAASTNPHPFGTGRSELPWQTTTSAKAPWAAPNTRSPTWNRLSLPSLGTPMTMPANSHPETHGNGGWCWYRPWTWRMSKKLAAHARTEMRYSDA